MARIYAPDRDTVAVGEYQRHPHGHFDIDDQDLAEHLLRFGWSHAVPEDLAPAAPAALDSLPPLKDLRKADLIALAQARGIDVTGNAPEIKARLRAYADQPPQPGDDTDPTD